jgi:hypothetical protein
VKRVDERKINLAEDFFSPKVFTQVQFTGEAHNLIHLDFISNLQPEIFDGCHAENIFFMNIHVEMEIRSMRHLNLLGNLLNYSSKLHSKLKIGRVTTLKQKLKSRDFIQ